MEKGDKVELAAICHYKKKSNLPKTCLVRTGDLKMIYPAWLERPQNNFNLHARRWSSNWSRMRNSQQSISITVSDNPSPVTVNSGYFLLPGLLHLELLTLFVSLSSPPLLFGSATLKVQGCIDIKGFKFRSSFAPPSRPIQARFPSATHARFDWKHQYN